MDVAIDVTRPDAPVADAAGQGAPAPGQRPDDSALDRGNADVVLTVQRFMQTGEQIFAVGRVTASITRPNGVVNTVSSRCGFPYC